jgi:hypothetical protein
VLCLQVIDDQVDQLAANAVKALGSLWGGINTVAKTSWGLTTAITTKVCAPVGVFERVFGHDSRA